MLFHSSEAWGDGREIAKSKQRVPGAAPQAAAAAPGSPCSRHSEERHQCLDNWNTFRGQFFTGPPARPFPTVTVLLHRTQPTDQQLPPLQKSPTTPLLHGHHPQQTLRSTCTHRTPPALLCKCDYKSMSPNLSPPSENLPPIQPLWGSAEPHTLHTLPCWTASTS